MNKLKTVFQRSSQKQRVIEDRRPQQFVKRHSSVAAAAATTTTPSTPHSGNMYDNNPPAIGFEDLSELEKPAYESWWKDLDPFDLKKINNQTVLKFLAGGCSLQDNKLEQILALFETAGDGLNKLQFFAMLRLIAHAQNGRKISRALVYLGAPVPHFHRNAIDALIKSDMAPPPQRQQLSDANNGTNDKENLQENGLEMIPNTIKHQRKSWWGNEKQQQSDHRRSYMGPFTAHTPIPNTTTYTATTSTTTATSTSESDTSMQDYFYPIPSITHHNTISNTPNHQWPHISPQPPLTIETSSSTTPHANNMIRPIFTSAMTTTATITPVTPNIIQLEEKQQYTHNRSRSAGNPSDFIHHNPYQLQATAPHATMVSEDQLHSSRSSLSLHELNTGQSLLLTQKFVYQSPSVRNQELSSANPFNQAEEPPLKSPFGDENHSDEDDYVAAIIEEEPASSTHFNYKPNQFSIPPPVVPTQSTKPAFPKYTRTNTFLVKRSLSTAVAVDRHKDEQLQHFTKHQRHKSTSATHDIFY